jgi:hypothetical protein
VKEEQEQQEKSPPQRLEAPIISSSQTSSKFRSQTSTSGSSERSKSDQKGTQLIDFSSDGG